MNKILRLSLVALLGMVCNFTMAQTVIDIDSDYKTLFPTITGESSQTSHDGDFTVETTSTAVDGITITVSPKASGSNDNRIWEKSPRLRMYSGTLKITSDKEIEKITIVNGKWNDQNTANVGTLDKDVWTVGDVATKEVVLTIAGNTQIKKIEVLCKGQEVVDITNTPETAYTVAKAIELIDAGKGLSTKVYVKGKISKIVSTASMEKYGQIDYNISDDGTETNELLMYNGLNLNGEKFTSADQIHVGDEVIVYGELTEFNGKKEMNRGNYIYSITTGTGINGVTTDKLDVNAPVFNLAGQRVSKDTKGILIQNGKKFINK